jgi:hypothetical protein
MTIEIEIINPISGKGLGRELFARQEPRDERNFILIGAVIKQTENEKVSYLNELELSITVPGDESQNHLYHGTGAWWGKPKSVGSDHRPCYYYPVTYYIRKPGKQEIIFKVGEAEKRLEFDVPEWDK